MVLFLRKRFRTDKSKPKLEQKKRKVREEGRVPGKTVEFENVSNMVTTGRLNASECAYANLIRNIYRLPFTFTYSVHSALSRIHQ